MRSPTGHRPTKVTNKLTLDIPINQSHTPHNDPRWTKGCVGTPPPPLRLRPAQPVSPCTLVRKCYILKAIRGYSMTYQTRLWLHKLVAALVGGGAAAVTAGVSVSLIDPHQWELLNLLKLMGVTFLLNGLMSVMMFLKDKPIPEWEGDDRRGQ